MTTPLSTQPTVVTVVRSSACHFCADAETALAELAGEIPITVEYVDADSRRGAALVREHRAPMYPLLLVDGEFFGFGRLSRKKLRRLLQARSSATVM